MQTDASSGEHTNTAGHLAEVVDRQVGVVIQSIERSVDGLDRLALGRGVGQNRLHGLHLKLVLGETVHDRLDGESLQEVGSSHNSPGGNVAQSDSGGDLESIERLRDESGLL